MSFATHRGATFDVVFFLELAVRVAIERRRFLKDGFKQGDLMISSFKGMFGR